MGTKSHDFKAGQGKVIEDGKNHWPDCLNISIPKHQILTLIQQLAHTLDVYEEDGYAQISFVGKLDYNIEE